MNYYLPFDCVVPSTHLPFCYCCSCYPACWVSGSASVFTEIPANLVPARLLSITWIIQNRWDTNYYKDPIICSTIKLTATASPMQWRHLAETTWTSHYIKRHKVVLIWPPSEWLAIADTISTQLTLPQLYPSTHTMEKNSDTWRGDELFVLLLFYLIATVF